MIKLYSYFRSSSSYRVRIALNLKGLDYEIIPVHLIKDGGEQFKDDFKDINAASKIPVLVDGEHTIAQSVAILEYLDEVYPEHKLYPESLAQKALTRQLVEIINSDIQPLQNLCVLKKIVRDHGFTDKQKVDWIKHWITEGFHSFETLLKKTAGTFCVGNQPGVADCFLIPQVYNAERFEVDMDKFPKIKEITARCLELEAFENAHPSNQPDTPVES